MLTEKPQKKRITPVERRGRVTRVLTNFGQLATGGTKWLERKVETFNGWHKPCDRRQSSTVPGGARGEIPRALLSEFPFFVLSGVVSARGKQLCRVAMINLFQSLAAKPESI